MSEAVSVSKLREWVLTQIEIETEALRRIISARIEPHGVTNQERKERKMRLQNTLYTLDEFAERH
jgi:hypothetical protein